MSRMRDPWHLCRQKKVPGKEKTMRQGNGLENKRVVILGGSSGIGLAVAEQAASHGAKIVIASSNAERVQKVVESFGGNGEGHALDLSDEQAVESLFKQLGAFDHLVFTA